MITFMCCMCPIRQTPLEIPRIVGKFPGHKSIQFFSQMARQLTDQLGNSLEFSESSLVS